MLFCYVWQLFTLSFDGKRHIGVWCTKDECLLGLHVCLEVDFRSLVPCWFESYELIAISAFFRETTRWRIEADTFFFFTLKENKKLLTFTKLLTFNNPFVKPLTWIKSYCFRGFWTWCFQKPMFCLRCPYIDINTWLAFTKP